MIACRAARMGAARLDVDADRAGVRCASVDRRAVDERTSGTRAGEPDDHLERGRLARAVRSEEPGDRARPHGERQVVDRRHIAIALRHILDRDRRSCWANRSIFHEDMIRGAVVAVIGAQNELRVRPGWDGTAGTSDQRRSRTPHHRMRHGYRMRGPRDPRGGIEPESRNQDALHEPRPALRRSRRPAPVMESGLRGHG